MRAAYDVIVVGGGHNGLVAAAYLARAGRHVLVLEARSVLGGAVAGQEIFPAARVSRFCYLVSLLPSQARTDLRVAGGVAFPARASYTPYGSAGIADRAAGRTRPEPPSVPSPATTPSTRRGSRSKQTTWRGSRPWSPRP